MTKISIHAPREGGDPFFVFGKIRHGRFQSTPPARGATNRGRDGQQQAYISIHAPREGGDVSMIFSKPLWLIFQSTPPARGATTRAIPSIKGKVFQSTPPARGATKKHHQQKGKHDISIHAPREGGDRPRQNGKSCLANFNPRPPRGGRPWGRTKEPEESEISIHAPREGGDSLSAHLP